MPKVYFVSGLGADERVFQFLDLPHVEPIYVKWLTPFEKETISHYAGRLISTQIDKDQDVYLVGISFGGIICQEIAKQIACKKVIIISSVKSAKEMGNQYKVLKCLRVDRVLPAKLLKDSNLRTAAYYFSTESEAETTFVKRIIEDTDEVFLKWAIDKIMTWDNHNEVPHLIHIHGSHDKIFPLKDIKGNVKKISGGHFMIVNKADIVSALLNQELDFHSI